MKKVKEKSLDQAFLRVMNKAIGSKDAFIPPELAPQKNMILFQDSFVRV